MVGLAGQVCARGLRRRRRVERQQRVRGRRRPRGVRRPWSAAADWASRPCAADTGGAAAPTQHCLRCHARLHRPCRWRRGSNPALPPLLRPPAPLLQVARRLEPSTASVATPACTTLAGGAAARTQHCLRYHARLHHPCRWHCGSNPALPPTPRSPAPPLQVVRRLEPSAAAHATLGSNPALPSLPHLACASTATSAAWSLP